MSTDPTGTAPTGTAPTGTARNTPMRVRTVVVGLIAIAISVAVIVSRLTRTHVDGGIVALLVVLTTGAVMVTAGVVSVVRSRR